MAETKTTMTLAEAARELRAHAERDSLTAEEGERLVPLAHAAYRNYDRADLFSAEEELEDISTAVLVHMRLPYDCAKMLLAAPAKVGAKNTAGMHAERILAVGTALEWMRRFLGDLHAVGVALGAQPMDPQKKMSPADERMMKIAMFKRKKEAQRLLEEVQEREKRERAVSPLSADSDCYGDEGRETVLAMLELCAVDAVEQMGLMQKELTMLEQISKMMGDGSFEEVYKRERAAIEKDAARMREPIKILPEMLNLREEFRKGVFRPPVPLATLMPDDPVALANDDALSGLRREQERPEREHLSEDDDSDRETDESLAEQRRHDDWADENPRGWGNTYGQG